MFFLVNNGPFAGEDGRAVTLRQIKDRLERELRVNVALRVEDLGRPDGVKVSGRGELHLAILIEEMRREGMELCVSRPEVITQRDARGQLLEPMEQLIIDVPDEYQGTVIQELSLRKGELTGMHASRTGLVRLEFTIPTRGLIGYRNDFLTETRGLGVMSSRFVGYGPWSGDLPGRDRGSLVSQAGGEAAGYSLENLQQRADAVRRPHGPRLRGHDRRRELARRRHALQPHQAQDSWATTGSPPRRSTRGSRSRARSRSRAPLEWIADDELVEVTPKIGARAQAHPEHRAAQEGRQADGRGRRRDRRPPSLRRRAGPARRAPALPAAASASACPRRATGRPRDRSGSGRSAWRHGDLGALRLDGRQRAKSEAAAVGAGHGRARGHDVAFADDLVDLEMQVWERRTQCRDDLFEVCGELGSERLLMVCARRVDRFVRVLQLAPVEHALESLEVFAFSWSVDIVHASSLHPHW